MKNQYNIVTQARGWLGTRFHHQGRLKKTNGHDGGCDCIGLILGVADELGLMTKDGSGRLLGEFDQKGYSRIPDGQSLQAALVQHLDEISVENITPGDILLFRFDKNPQHVGFVSDYAGRLGLIHCYMQARKVVEHRLDGLWRSRIVAAYRF